jgi:hypothetical protein
MEFLGGIVFTLVAEFIGYKIYQSRQRSKDRKVQATRRAGPYPDHNPDMHKK